MNDCPFSLGWVVRWHVLMHDESNDFNQIQATIPTSGRLCGVDFGTVRIGLATCDPSQTWVSPFDTYARRNERLDRTFFMELVHREALVAWIIGLPIHCDGRESEKSKQVRDFADWLADLSQLPVALYDERFSTAEARKLLREVAISPQKKKKQLDRLAAHLILSHFLDSRRSEMSQNEPLEDC